MKNMLNHWSTFEKTWLSVFLLINFYLFFAFDDTILGLVSSTAGVLCVVLAGKGRMATYYVGIIQASTYAYISYTYSLYGEAMLNGLFYLPMQFVGIYMWNKARVGNGVVGEQIAVQRLNQKQWLFVVGIIIFASSLYAIFLNRIGGQQVGLDSLTVIMSIVAQILMVKRYVEQWVLWIAINILTIILWVVALIQNGGNDWAMVLMWSAFLMNSIISYYNWKRMYKGQKGSVTNA